MNNLTNKQPPVFPIEKVDIPEADALRLKNGIPVYIIEAGTEDIMRIEFTFKAGQIKEQMPLMASTTNMMLSEGSHLHTSEELNSLLDYYGSFFNLSTDKDSAGLVLFILNKHLDKVLSLCKEILYHPAFPEHEFNSLMKKRLRWFMVNREKVHNMASDKFFESLFGTNHPYGYQITEKDFESISTEHLSDFHKRYYTPDNMAIIISGKMHKETKELLNHHFGNLPVEKTGTVDRVYILQGENKKHVHVDKPGSVQSAIRIGSSTINKRHPDYIGLKILNTILGGYFSSRLMKNIREEKGYTYGINSSVSSLDLTGYKVISTEVSKKNYLQTIDEIYKEIRLLQTVNVEKDELTVVRNYISGEMIRMFDGPFALAESFKSAWEFGLDNSYYYKLFEKIKTIDPDEIIELARTYYNIDELYEITVGIK